MNTHLVNPHIYSMPTFRALNRPFPGAFKTAPIWSIR